MTLLQPAMLWSLLVLLPLTAIYFLKVRPRRKPTTAYFLWDKIFQERKASSLFQRLRDAWSLVLMLLAAAAVCFALARPEWADERKDLILIIDNSASMAAKEGGSTRLELAKAVANDVVQGLNGNQLAAVATLAGRLSYRSHLTDNPRELMDAVAAIAPSGEALDAGALPIGNDESGRWAKDHRILFISDAAFDVDKLPPRVELLKVGSTVENLGLVTADMAYLPGGHNRLGFYYHVASTFREPQQVDLTLSALDVDAQEQLFKVIPLTVQPGSNPPETFELEQAPPGRWIARLDVADSLADDNTAFLAVTKPEPIAVAVHSTDPFFLENSVQAFSQGEGLLKLVTDEPTIVLAKSITPEVQNAIIFQPAGESAWWSEIGDEIVAGPARVLIERHPALRHLDASSIPFVGARQLKPRPGAQILVADDHDLPLIYKARHEGRTAIVVNMDPVAAEFYFSAWFPVLIHSAATHLAGRENVIAAAYRPGESVPIVGGRDDVATKVATPAATSDVSPLEVHGAWFNAVEQLGFYRLTNSAGAHDFGANIFSDYESLLNNDAAVSNHEPLSRGRSPAQWLTLLAIVVLAAESALYHRRKVG